MDIKKEQLYHGYDYKRAERLKTYTKKLEKFKDELQKKQIEVEEYIETIPFSDIRQIMRLHYEEGFNWIQISHELNNMFSSKVTKYTADSVRMKHDRYLKRN